MKDQRINEAIAKYCGWDHLACGFGWKKAGDGEVHARIPAYVSDLNAMHEAEKKLKITISRANVFFCLAENEANRFTHYLYEICVRDNDSHPVNATARQRAEAFLKTVRKWEDG